MNFWTALPATSSTVFFAPASSRVSSPSGPSSADCSAVPLPRISSINFCAAGMSASSPFMERFISMSVISRRLISLVPSKIRFTR